MTEIWLLFSLESEDKFRLTGFGFRKRNVDDSLFDLLMAGEVLRSRGDGAINELSSLKLCWPLLVVESNETFRWHAGFMPFV